MEKKAQIGSVFKYIFAMIIGAIFIVFFINFAFQEAETGEAITSAKFVQGFNDLLTELTVNEDVKMVYEFPVEEKLEFENGEISKSTEARKISKKTSQIIFAPKQLVTKKLTIWTKKWRWPFEITNVFYMWDGRTQTYLIYDDKTEEALEDLIEENEDTLKAISVKLMTFDNFSKIKNQVPKIATIIWFTENKPLAMPQNILKVRPSQNKEVGTIVFDDGTELPYIGVEMLIGAAFTQDLEQYQYTLNQLNKKIKFMQQIYLNKMIYMKMKKQGCEEDYQQFTTLLSQDLQSPEQYFNFKDQLYETNRRAEAGCKIF